MFDVYVDKRFVVARVKVVDAERHDSELDSTWYDVQEGILSSRRRTESFASCPGNCDVVHANTSGADGPFGTVDVAFTRCGRSDRQCVAAERSLRRRSSSRPAGSRTLSQEWCPRQFRRLILCTRRYPVRSAYKR